MVCILGLVGSVGHPCTGCYIVGAQSVSSCAHSQTGRVRSLDLLVAQGEPRECFGFERSFGSCAENGLQRRKGDEGIWGP